MKLILLYIAPLLLVFPTDALLNDNTESSEYELIKSEEGINLYYKWIHTDKKDKVRVLKVQLIVEDTFSNILDAIKNDDKVKIWLNSVKVHRNIQQTDNSNWYTYILFEAPWPFRNQDCILKFNTGSQNDQTKINFSNVPDFIKEIDGIKRMGHLEGKWLLTSISNNKTLVEYEMFSDQQPIFPRWIIDPIIQNSIWNSMYKFRSLIETNN